MLAAFALCMAFYVLLSPRTTLADLVPLEKRRRCSPIARNRSSKEFGYTDNGRRTQQQNFIIPPDFVRWLANTDRDAEPLEPSARVARCGR